MLLNNAGRMVEKWYYKLGNKYPDKKCHDMVIMPNYFHCIVENIMKNDEMGNAMDWFKTMTTNEYIRGVKQFGWQRFDKKLWKRNYYEHIIRNDHLFERISKYIQNNPSEWGNDKFNG